MALVINSNQTKQDEAAARTTGKVRGFPLNALDDCGSTLLGWCSEDGSRKGAEEEDWCGEHFG
jgi:hypothetical protein